MDRKIVELLMQKKSQREIKIHLQVGQGRITRIHALAEHYGYLSGVVPLPPYPEALFPDGPDTCHLKTSDADQKLLEKKDWIIDRLKSLWHPITIFEELNLSISRSSFYRFLIRHRLNKIGVKSRARVVPEIVHQPGEALILDWGKLRDVIDPETGKKKTLWAFVGVLGFSRYMMVRLVWTNSVEVTIAAIESMLQEMGGVPFKVTSDNPKCFATEASRYEPILNSVFERFASFYRIMMECLPPADPQKKGKVERLMPFVRRLYEGHGPEWKGLKESQEYLDKKLVIANERVHGTTRLKPIDQFLNREAVQLKPLPAVSYAPEEILEAKVRADGHVRFDNKYYSLPEQLIHQPVTIVATASEVSLYHEGKLIELHPRLAAEDIRSKSTKEHHKKPWERIMDDHVVYHARAQAIGLHCDQLITQLLHQKNGFIDLRKIWGILSLDKAYSKEQINEACHQAILLKSYSYQTVKRLLKIAPQPATTPTETTQARTHKFVRPMSVYEEQYKLH